MTEEDTNTVDIKDVSDDDFEAEFFSNNTAKAEVVENKEDEVVEENVDETEDNSLADEDENAEEVEDTEEDEEEPEAEETPKPKKRNRVQERIEQLLERERLANDKAHQLELRLAAIEAGNKEKVQKDEAPALRDVLPSDAPNPDALNEDGKPVYELGEFDHKYLRDLAKYTVMEEMKVARAEEQKKAQEQMVVEARKEIESKWIDNLDKAEQKVPEIRENIREMQSVFANIEPQYGEYLAMTVMNLDNGPEILNYLSQNIGEAQKIVASGPHAATFALGRLDAKFETSTEEKTKRNTKQVSKAPDPPEDRTRGRGGKFAVAPDTDDDAAFERVFFA